MPALRVVALATNIPGPLAAERLAAAGARVVKIEPPAGDPLQAAAPQWYVRIVRAMQVERLDLAADGPGRLLDFLNGADLFLTTVRPRALERRGLGAASLATRFRRLCYVQIVGASGDASDRAGHDLTYQARAGLLTPPSHPRAAFADMFAAERAVAAAYELLYERETTGTGGFRQVAIADGAAQLNDASRFGLTAPDGPLGGAFALYRMYRAADGWIAVAALEGHFQQQLALALETDDLSAPNLELIFARRDRAHWQSLAERLDLPLEPLPDAGSE